MSTAPSAFHIKTASGRFINPAAPLAEQIVFGDIARALSQLCRYTGHTSRFYSVAEHSVAVSLAVRAALEAKKASPALVAYGALRGLLHDAPEAYIGDVSSPMKRNPDGMLNRERYEEIDQRLMQVIWRALILPGCPAPYADDDIQYFVHEADSRTVLAWERYFFFMGYPRPDGWPPTYPTRDGLPPNRAFDVFTSEYCRIPRDLGRL